jgi:dTDP-4-amino-4,6-dideoxygalactose transaminase
VHLYGRAADIRDVAHAIKPARVPIIEDAAQAFGAGVPRQSTAMAGAAHNIPLTRAGTVGIAGCFSFYPTKNLGAMGEGGAVATNNAALAERLRLLRAQGSRTRYMHELLGWNARMHEIQAAILRVKLRYVDDWNARRMRIARSYEEQLLASGIAELASQTDFSKPSPLVLPDRVAGHSFHQYVIRAQDRDGLREFLKTRGIGTEVYYPVPAHFQPAMQARLSRDSFPQAERAAREVLALPMFPELTDREVERVTTALCSFFETKRSKE